MRPFPRPIITAKTNGGWLREERYRIATTFGLNKETQKNYSIIVGLIFTISFSLLTAINCLPCPRFGDTSMFSHSSMILVVSNVKVGGGHEEEEDEDIFGDADDDERGTRKWKRP